MQNTRKSNRGKLRHVEKQFSVKRVGEIFARAIMQDALYTRQAHSTSNDQNNDSFLNI